MIPVLLDYILVPAFFLQLITVFYILELWLFTLNCTENHNTGGKRESHIRNQIYCKSPP